MSPASKLPQFLDRILVTGHVRKRHNYILRDPRDPMRGSVAVDTYWERKDHLYFQQPAPVIYLGWRTMAEGHINHHYEDGNTFEPSKHLMVYLVVRNERSNPFYVLPDQVQIVSPELAPAEDAAEEQAAVLRLASRRAARRM